MLWMIAASLAGWVALLVMTGGAFAREIGAGVAGPLVVSALSWQLVAGTFRANPGRVQAMMIRAFAVKLVFFIAYIVLMIRGLGLQPVPFALSFTGFFVALHAMQAALMRRLFLTGARSAA